MYALFKKEVRYFFTSAIGLTIIGLFVVLNGLFLCVFKTDYNLFNAGFADLLPFFSPLIVAIRFLSACPDDAQYF